MHPIKIRDLKTGEVLTRHGANAEELLASYEPEYVRDDDGEIVLHELNDAGEMVPSDKGKPQAVLDDEGKPVLTTEKRYVRLGAEPRKWKEAQAAKADAAAAGETADETAEDNSDKPAASGRRQRKRV